MRVVAMLNLKGGVGKTSATLHVGAALAKLGRRVLLVDNDPQSSLTQGFLGPDGASALPEPATVSAVHAPGSEPDPDGLVLPTGLPGVSLLPGSKRAGRWNRMPDADWPASQWGLRSLLAAVRADHDLALIDCPPNLYFCSWAAMLASDRILVPVQPEDFGSQGLADVHEYMEFGRRINPGLGLLGYLLSMADKRLAVHAAYEQQLRDTYGDLVLANALPLSKDFKEAVTYRAPVTAHRPRSAAARAALAVAAEVLARVEAIDAGGAGEGVAA